MAGMLSQGSGKGESKPVRRCLERADSGPPSPEELQDPSYTGHMHPTPPGQSFLLPKPKARQKHPTRAQERNTVCAKPLLSALATVAPLAQPTHLGQMSPQKHQATTVTSHPTPHTPLIPATDPTFGKISQLAKAPVDRPCSREVAVGMLAVWCWAQLRVS